ncbi:DoxX family membrane protein [Nocardiopsis ansamitocini]|uniref:DoxX family protein n=1 Tax=Nocardiopsis ansamitocini TaxID=1670832 RepID=A0A9W6P436_9ACTN|nr:DoxX family membrane protein [Nocardiopsis ansamitocini]GLU46734.1 hypothetical protein Nans01_10850 [Nocardiopsis ansamitocini]
MGVIRNQARRLLAAPFLLDGLASLRDPAPRAKELEPTVHRLSARYTWLPDDPELVVRVQGAASVLGATLLIAGKANRSACVLLAAQSVPTLLADLRAARGGDPQERSRLRATAVKDLSLLGALVLAATEPKKRPSPLRRETEHAVDRARRGSARVRAKAERQARALAARSR